MHHYKSMALTATLVAVIMVCAAAIPAARDLSHARAEGEGAWRDIARIHSARNDGAATALNVAAAGGRVDAGLAAKAQASLARAKAFRADDSVLYDAVQINAYKQRQGELTGVLLTLAAPAPDAGDVLHALHADLVRDEAALAEARARYDQASSRYRAIANTVTGATVATLLRYPDLPATL